MIIFAIATAFITHEGGHLLAALCFGKGLRFKFAWGKYYVPRYVWDMPDLPRWQQRVIALAGFGTELAIIPLMPWAYAVVAGLHLAAYRFYAGEENDFKWV